MDSSILNQWARAALLSLLSICVVSCSKSEIDFDSDILDSPGALQASKELSVEERFVLGAWKVSVEGGNQHFYKVPNRVMLTPFDREGSDDSSLHDLRPRIPKGNVFSKDSFWTLEEDDELHLWWSDDVCGVRVVVHPVDGGKWEGVVEAVWDLSSKEERKSVVLERL